MCSLAALSCCVAPPVVWWMKLSCHCTLQEKVVLSIIFVNSVNILCYFHTNKLHFIYLVYLAHYFYSFQLCSTFYWLALLFRLLTLGPV